MCDDPYIPRAELEKLLGGALKTSRIVEMVRRGELDAIRPGGKNGNWLVKRSEAKWLLSKPEAKK